MQTNKISFLVFLGFLATLIIPTSTFAQEKDSDFIIMIDAGHGGKDSGTPGTGRYKTTEKDIALDVTLALGKMIETQLNNVGVIYTRTKDTYPTLNGRAVLANDKDVDLFISVHCNAQPGKKGTAYGTETFVLGLHKSAANLEVAKRENSVIYLEENHEEVYKDFNPSSPESMIGLILSQEDFLDQSIELARYIEDEFQVTAKRKSRGVKQAGLYVLAYTYMPSVLVELGFLTHKKEEDFLNSKKGKKIMTQSLFNAVKKYLDSKMLNTSGVISSEDVSFDDVPAQIYNNIVFKVQIAASSRKLEPKAYNFKGLKEVSREKESNLYKYYYGYTSDYSKIKQYQVNAKAKGYDTCYIVAFKDGKKINLNEALKTSLN